MQEFSVNISSITMILLFGVGFNIHKSYTGRNFCITYEECNVAQQDRLYE
jgi:hypothetical protein